MHLNIFLHCIIITENNFVEETDAGRQSVLGPDILGMPLSPSLLSPFSSWPMMGPAHTWPPQPFGHSLFRDRQGRAWGALVQQLYHWVFCKDSCTPLLFSHPEVTLLLFPNSRPLLHIFGPVFLPCAMFIFLYPLVHTLLSVMNVPSPLISLPKSFTNPPWSPLWLLHPPNISQLASLS